MKKGPELVGIPVDDVLSIEPNKGIHQFYIVTVGKRKNWLSRTLIPLCRLHWIAWQNRGGSEFEEDKGWKDGNKPGAVSDVIGRRLIRINLPN